MAKSSPSLRARDIDRALVATALDNAYADGQLTFEEHRARVGRARAAKTLGELHALAADLQADVALPEVPVVRGGGQGRALLLGAALVVTLVIAAILIAVFTGDSDTDDQQVTGISRPVATADGDVTPIVARPFSFTTPEGFDDFRHRYLDRFDGDPIVVDLTIYPAPEDDRASVERFTSEGRVQRVDVRGGFDVSPDSELATSDDLPVNITTIDFAKLAGHMAGAATFVEVPDATISHVVIRNSGTPEILIFASDADNRGGYFETTLAGEVVGTSPYRP